MHQAIINTPLGIATIYGSEQGISKVTLSDEELPITNTIPPCLEDALIQLNEYFKGERKEFTFRLDPMGTDFQKKVWAALCEIPFGTTTSYHQLSIQMGDVKAIRAVAAANGKNPLWIVVPCHRVIGSDGSLTGYAGGIWRKKWLLEHEDPARQRSLF